MPSTAAPWSILLPHAVRLLIPVVISALVIGLVLYGIDVVLESRVLKLGHQARVLQEDNQDLQIHLDRLRSYRNVANASAHYRGLETAHDIIDVPGTLERTIPRSQPAARPLPPGVYGF